MSALGRDFVCSSSIAQHRVGTQEPPEKWDRGMGVSEYMLKASLAAQW